MNTRRLSIVATVSAALLVTGCGTTSTSSTPSTTTAPTPTPTVTETPTAAATVDPSPTSTPTFGSPENATITIGDLDLSGTWQTWCYEYKGQPWINLSMGADRVFVILGADGTSVEQVSGTGSTYNFSYSKDIELAVPTIVQDGNVYTISGEAAEITGGYTVLPFQVTATCATGSFVIP